jgi:hypothetical protein
MKPACFLRTSLGSTTITSSWSSLIGTVSAPQEKAMTQPKHVIAAMSLALALAAPLNVRADEGFKIVSVYSGQVIDAAGQSGAVGGSIIQWPWWNGTNQKWAIRESPDQCG